MIIYILTHNRDEFTKKLLLFVFPHHHEIRLKGRVERQLPARIIIRRPAYLESVPMQYRFLTPRKNI
jgi:hypothetical protein